ncbi:TlpA family protein disulfide reductase [Chryseobacterium sp. D764]|jgi:thiol-disulfide isomerase/thioredoxin|uniref:TlpA family protein disulfide reductase n=1 Tax=unclassified Chryseobacterium TaxID=2593645 RepID=UPI0009859F1B|nr:MULTISPECIES: TlpA disulfide reductase family protein [unclassified Chryseobacterium]QXU50571.1 TlpA family protein disulfide reductase [Chryseobacterium sp. D764]
MLKKIILIIIIPAAAIFLGLKFIKISTVDPPIINQLKTKFSGNIEDSPFQKEYLNKDGLVVVNVWAPWCKPCIQEIPTFKKISKENPNIKFVFLSIDEDAEKLKTFLANNTINDITLQNIEYIEAIKTFLGGNGLLGYSSIPLTFIIKDGKVIDKNVGSIDYNEFTTHLKTLQ